MKPKIHFLELNFIFTSGKGFFPFLSQQYMFSKFSSIGKLFIFSPNNFFDTFSRFPLDFADDDFMGDYKYIDADQTTGYRNFTPPMERDSFFHGRLMTVDRDVTFKDVETQKLVVMPGFRFRWWYSGAEVTPEEKYIDEENNKQFIR